MKRNVIVLTITLALFLTSPFSSASYAEEIVHGVTTFFGAKSGKLVLQTSQGELSASLPRTVKVYVRASLSHKEIPVTWKFLQDNLMRGTKVTIHTSGDMVTAIVVTEVPR